MAEGDKPGSSVLGKVVATVFGAVVAPLLVAFGIQYFGLKKDPGPQQPLAGVQEQDKQAAPGKDKLEPPPKDKPDSVSKDKQDQTPKDKAEPADRDKSAKDKDKLVKDKQIRDKSGKKLPPVDPTLHLAEGDLGKWWTVYERVSEKIADKEKDKKVLEKDKGPKDAASHFVQLSAKEAGAIFRHQDGAIHTPGPRYGALVSKEQYENYLLTVEYKLPKVPPTTGEKVKSRRTGFVLHAQDDGKAPWMPGIQCLLVPGDMGALQLRGESLRVSVTARVVEKTDEIKKGPKAGMTVVRRDYKPDATPKAMTSGAKGGWNGVIHRLGHDASLADGDDPAAGKDNPEKANDWNRLDCHCDGEKITIVLNDKEVNACTNVSPRKGHIVILAEGSPVFYRRIDLFPLKK
jgi:hypothetical protein